MGSEGIGFFVGFVLGILLIVLLYDTMEQCHTISTLDETCKQLMGDEYTYKNYEFGTDKKLYCTKGTAFDNTTLIQRLD